MPPQGQRQRLSDLSAADAAALDQDKKVSDIQPDDSFQLDVITDQSVKSVAQPQSPTDPAGAHFVPGYSLTM